MPLAFPFLSLSGHAQKFDLPFHMRLGTEFLVFLTALMTVLCLLAVTASLGLSQLAGKWTSGLENTLTIEIPHSAKQESIGTSILTALRDAEGVKSAHLLDRDEMGDLLSPWFGDKAVELEDLPMPTLITIELKERDERVLKGLSLMARDISPDIRIDTHEQWLSDLLRLTSALKLIAYSVMIAICLVTALTVGGAVRSRMAIHHTELELLHIMGADDGYIARQFQKYICWLCGKGILLGFIVCTLGVLALQLASMSSAQALPGLRLTPVQFLALPAAAFMLLLISGWTARTTALKVLRGMP